MRTLNRNKQTIYYALYQGSTDEVDSYGDYTGEKTPYYSEATALEANVSAARGTADSELFGINVNYSRTVCIEELDCPIAEDTILWVNNDPTTDPYDYVVVAIAKSLNNIVYAIQEVKVSGTVAPPPTPTPTPDESEQVDGEDNG